MLSNCARLRDSEPQLPKAASFLLILYLLQRILLTFCSIPFLVYIVDGTFLEEIPSSR